MEPRPSMNAFPPSLRVKYVGKMTDEVAQKARPTVTIAPKRALPQMQRGAAVSGRPIKR